MHKLKKSHIHNNFHKRHEISWRDMWHNGQCISQYRYSFTIVVISRWTSLLFMKNLSFHVMQPVYWIKQKIRMFDRTCRCTEISLRPVVFAGPMMCTTKQYSWNEFKWLEDDNVWLDTLLHLNIRIETRFTHTNKYQVEDSFTLKSNMAHHIRFMRSMHFLYRWLLIGT